MIQKILRVKEVNAYIKRVLDYDPILRNIKVIGELSSFKAHSSGHAYFALKDEDGRIPCVMFSSSFANVDFTPKDGDEIVLKGRISIYERDGKLQLYVNEMKKAGQGILYERFLALKDKLEKEGLFDPVHKKSIPQIPSKIALITSATGAAVHDYITTFRRRNPFTDLVIVPTTMQGEKTVSEVIRGVEWASLQEDIDLIVITRGGGAYEELFSFNDESLARSIFSATTPIISAIGHEVDVTIADFVADMRAATPTAAAELSSQDLSGQAEAIDLFKARLKRAISYHLDGAKNRLESLGLKDFAFAIDKKLIDDQYQLDLAGDQLTGKIKQKVDANEQKLALLGNTLHHISPLQYLEKGYTRLTVEERLVKSTQEVAVGQRAKATYLDGHVELLVKEVMQNGTKE